MSRFPTVLPGTLGTTLPLTVQGRASAPYPMRLLSWVGLAFLLLTIAHQALSSCVFCQRVCAQDDAMPGGADA